jgi:hypothetical protein
VHFKTSSRAIFNVMTGQKWPVDPMLATPDLVEWLSKPKTYLNDQKYFYFPLIYELGVNLHPMFFE